MIGALAVLRYCQTICQITPVTNIMMSFTNDNLDCLWRFGSGLLAFGLKTVLSLRKRAEAEELTCPIGAMKQTPETTNNTTPSAPIAGAAMAGKVVSRCITLALGGTRKD